jgi:hypothetical protein
MTCKTASSHPQPTIERIGPMSDPLFTVSCLNMMRVPKPISWQPKPDITAYELAQAMAVLISLGRGGMHIECEDAIAVLPDAVKRHFVIGSS